MKFDLPALIAGQKPHPIHRNQHHRSLATATATAAVAGAAANQSNKPTEPIRKSLSLHKLPNCRHL